MKYQNGDAVHVGDTVALGNDTIGIVVGIIEEKLYASGYKSADWQYLGRGLIVSTSFGDVRLSEPDEDMELVERQKTRLQPGY